jgi:hypothetical protein
MPHKKKSGASEKHACQPLKDPSEHEQTLEGTSTGSEDNPTAVPPPPIPQTRPPLAEAQAERDEDMQLNHVSKICACLICQLRQIEGKYYQDLDSAPPGSSYPKIGVLFPEYWNLVEREKTSEDKAKYVGAIILSPDHQQVYLGWKKV